MRRKILIAFLSLVVFAGVFILPHTPVWANPAFPPQDSMTTFHPPADRAGSMPTPATKHHHILSPGTVHVRVSGLIRALPSQLLGEWTVGNATVLVDVNTRIQPRGYVPQVGDWADVWATAQTNKPLLATFVRITTQSESNLRHVEFKGLVEEITEDFLIISGTTVRLDEHTQIIGTPALGFIAQVHGSFQTDGSVMAILIQITDPLEVRVDFEGVIQDLPSHSPYYGEWRIGGFTIVADEHTEISGLAPSVGLNAEVSGVLQNGERIHAIEIRVTDPTQISIEGVVRSIRETEWVIGDTIVQVNENTFIDESKASASVGAWAEARVQATAGGLLAIRIRLKRPH